MPGIKRTEKIQESLRRSIRDLPTGSIVIVHCPETNEIHRFSVQDSVLGHLESHDRYEIVKLIEGRKHLHSDGRRS